MLRRDPTTIHLIAEDIRDLGTEFDVDTIIELQSQNDLSINQIEIDNQNWDTSVDESYLGSRNRERELHPDIQRLRELQKDALYNGLDIDHLLNDDRNTSNIADSNANADNNQNDTNTVDTRILESLDETADIHSVKSNESKY